MSVKEKGQYALAFGVIALMLYIVGFPVFLLVFFGVLAFFVWKVFTAETRSETRRVFEFYLSASEILRDDERRWYGFELKDAIARGEAVIKLMTSPPPLVHFALGALYAKLGDHSSAVRSLSYVTGDAASDETSIVFPTKDLREYVTMLRKIERAPAEAPLTSAAVRFLERARRNRANDLLADSRARLTESVTDVSPSIGALSAPVTDLAETDLPRPESIVSTTAHDDSAKIERRRKQKSTDQSSEFTDRKTISEVLHDIYDKNVH